MDLSYLILSGHVKHDGRRYGEGELILLSAHDAAPLLAEDIIALPLQDGPAIDETREEVPEFEDTDIGKTEEEVPTESEPTAFLIHLESSEPDQVGEIRSPGRPRKKR